jgi:tRNA A-37 threonylcarbamoyl transferase component Bud32
MIDPTEMRSPDDATIDRSRVVAGRYEILERVGAGTMGQVLHVRHLRLGKEFALKLMQAELALDAEACALFVAEARLASALAHPNIVSIVDFGEDPDWGLFIAMEFLEGEALSERIARGGRMTVELACHVARQLARALDHSHGNQVVHGDVKSENVLCVSDPSEDGDSWHVKLLDFGTARVARPLPEREEEIVGTPAYVAPERITGNAPAASNDIYALGILMYEMLTGETPFMRDTVLAVLEAHLSDTAEPVGARRGEVLDDQLVDIVERCLAKAPGDRYQTAGEVADALTAYVHAFGIRERALAQRIGTTSYTREEAAGDAFDAIGVACAGLEVDGTIRVANAAFARLLRADTVEDIEGVNVHTTALGMMHSGIRDDVRLAAMHGEIVGRRLSISRDGASVIVELRLSPASGRCGPCMLAVHSVAQP